MQRSNHSSAETIEETANDSFDILQFAASKSDNMPSKSLKRDNRKKQVKKWLRTDTVSIFWKSLLVSLLCLLPGLILHFGYSYKLLGLDALNLFATVSVFICFYPFVHLILHLLFYHVIPVWVYDSSFLGNILFFSVDAIGYLTGAVCLVGSFFICNYGFPVIFRLDNADVYYYINCTLGVLLMWVLVMGIKKLTISLTKFQFQRNTYIDRIHLSLFLHFVFEVFREVKRRKKRNLQLEFSTSLQESLMNLVVPNVLLPEQIPKHEPQSVSAHEWKLLLDEFYDTVSKHKAWNDFENSVHANEPQTVLGVSEPTPHENITLKRSTETRRYHHLNYHKHESNFIEFNFLDEHAEKLSGKLFESLKDADSDYLDVDTHILPLFQSEILSGRSSKEVEHITLVRDAVATFFNRKSNECKLILPELKEHIQRSYREQARLIASLSGMTEAIRSVDDWITSILRIILILITLAVYGVNVFGVLVSISSAMVSFAFLFGGVARQAFDGVVFLFFVHVSVYINFQAQSAYNITFTQAL